MVNYNYGRYLREAIDSALNQTVAPIEVVVVDDGSTDESREVIASYGNQIRALLVDHNGQAAGMNTAFAQCSGDVICLLDSDDLMVPRRVEGLIDAYSSHPDCQWVFHRLDWIDRATREPLATPISHDFTSGFHDERPFLRRGWFSMNAPATSALSWRTGFLKELLPISARLRGFDNYLKFGSLAMAPGWVIDEVLGFQGIHDSNLYTTMKGNDRRCFYVRNGVAMAPRFEALGLPMLAERLMADALVKGHAGRDLDAEHRDIFLQWFSRLPLFRRARLAAYCGVVGAEAVTQRAGVSFPHPHSLRSRTKEWLTFFSSPRNGPPTAPDGQRTRALCRHKSVPRQQQSRV
jgi:hypothetical protein